MRRGVVLSHKFVEFVPDTMDEGVIYVSMVFATAAHRCCCGCGHVVVTPLSPTDWKLTFDGRTISLDPSIGNWGFACQSHYWISNGRVAWAGRMGQEEIGAMRAHDSLLKSRYYGRPGALGPARGAESGDAGTEPVWAKLKSWWVSRRKTI